MKRLTGSEIVVRGGAVWTGGMLRSAHDISIQDGRIVAVGKGLADGGARVIDARQYRVVPGLLDLHVHGAVGHDTMDADPRGLAEMAAFYARHGVTGFLATTVTASPEATEAAVRCVAEYGAHPGNGARVLGVHLEGPFINPAAKGAQIESQCRAPDPAELRRLAALAAVRLITLAPELPGAEQLIREAQELGITVSVGHTRACYAQARAAFDWGVRHATHTFNTMPPLHHREPGAVGAILSDDRVTAELILDHIHVHPAIAMLIVRAKGPERVALVTDAIRAAGLPDGMYELGGQAVVVQDGACWLADAAGAIAATRTLAGSTLTLERALSNVQTDCGLSLGEALPMVTSVPARVMGLSGQLGALEPGLPADLVLLDADGQVALTMVGGAVVYSREGTDVIS